MKNINLTLSDELFAMLEAARGDVPRVVWIRRAIEQRIASEKEQNR